MINLATIASKNTPVEQAVETKDQSLDSLLSLRTAYQQASTQPVDTVLLYGPPKTGKTALAGSIAKMDSVDRILYFDVEDSITTLLNPALEMSDEHLAKIQLIPIQDTKSSNVAIETLLKYFSTTTGESTDMCRLHNKISCGRCKQNKAPVYRIPTVHTLTSRDCIIIDTMSQVGVSAFWAGEVLAKREEAATGKSNAFAKYAKQGELLLDLLTMIQAVRTVNVICTAHSYTLDEDDKTRPTMTVPAIGTQNFSRNVGKFFPTIVYMSVEGKRFKAGSSPTYKLNTLAGSRLGKKVESITDRSPTMSDILSL